MRVGTAADDVLKFVISAFVAVVLLGQLVVGFTYHASTFWPITSYPMYSVSVPEGGRFDDYTVQVVLEDGRRIQVVPDDVEMGYWIFRENVVLPAIREETEILRPFVARVCETYDAAVTRIEVFDIGVWTSWNGPVFGEPEQQQVLNVSCDA